MSGPPALVLASASPRRRALLAAAGLVFEVEPSEVDEALSPAEERLGPEAVAALLAERKAREVLARLAPGPVPGPGAPERLVLGSDTVVAVGEEGGAARLGKPRDAAEAAAMLARLSGTRHRVVTGVCVLRASDGARFADVERTWVTMRPIAPAEIEAYVASGEWRDKAGGYAIQETADAFVVRLEEGGFDNVVGLPVALAQRLLARAAGDV